MTSLLRREFLLRALAACGTVAYASAGPRGAEAAGAVPGAARSISAGYFGDQVDAVRVIGEAHLRQLGVEAGDASIRSAARTTLAMIERARDQPRAIRALEQAVRQDFERGRTVQVEGWILSKTEADLCALSLLEDDLSR
ncbi:MAG: hypothetical protein FJW22_11605 [Acidimicrobiia bacterium]|nr:hypothetical protein [Acidimicrobiia bacterium]